jgi:hypothetical protein
MHLTIGLLAILLAASAAGQDSPAAPAANSSGPQLPPAFATRKLDVEIPFAVTSGSDPQAQATTVQVFVSWDFGRNWHKYTEVPAEAGKFRFKAKKDAEFWFVTETVDVKRPPRDTPKRPQLRLVVDTQKPELRAAAAVNPAGQVDFTFGAADPNLNSQTLKLEYQDARDEESPWEPVPLAAGQLTPSRGGLAGRSAFLPREGLRTINVRAEIADVAGNKSYFHQQLAIPSSDARTRQVPSPLAMDAGARRWPSDNRLPGDTNPGGMDAGAETIARPPSRPQDGTTNVVTNPHIRRERLAASPTPPSATEELLPPRQPALPERAQPTFPELSAPGGIAPQPAEESLPPPQDVPARDIPPPDSRPQQPGPDLSNADVGPVPEEEPLPHPADGSSGSDSIAASRGPDITTTDSIPAGTQPRLTNTKHFSLDYDVESVGPEGVAEVELWGTSDGGKSWLKWGNDPDRTSPMEVEVAHEANYGFRVVILGKNGLEGNKPQSGDDADIWVSIDATQPAARITAAAYGSGQDAGKLDIRWEAADANLGERPVSLLYSDRPDGKFTVIAAGLANTGQYLWQFDPRSPRTIYLRLEVRDSAGNIAIDQLRDPIAVEGLIPKGRIRSLSPAPEPLPQSGAFSSPLFR